VAKTEWGLKRTCLSCGARFYDLNNSPIVCPKCETTFDPAAAVKLKRNRNVPADVKAVKKEDAVLETETDSDTLEDALDNTEDEDILDDTSDLESGDDVGVAIPTDENQEDT